MTRIEFDPVKDAANRKKHGVSLALASELEWAAALAWADDRFDYEETRIAALAPKGEVLFFVAFVDRGDTRRVISLRCANRREVKHYVEHSQEAEADDADPNREPRDYRRGEG